MVVAVAGSHWEEVDLDKRSAGFRVGPAVSVQRASFFGGGVREC